MAKSSFEWDEHKNAENQSKHGVPFALAQYARADPQRIIAEDTANNGKEQRYFCFGRVGEGILTVRFTYRSRVIRIIGAGYWRNDKAFYERENQLHECADRHSEGDSRLPAFSGRVGVP